MGLDSSEVDHPPEEFAEAYAMARAAGLRPVAHAGEEGPPPYITGALDALGAQHIDHGVRCEEDPELVARLVEAQIPLTVCPLSNLALCVVDDPAYFGGHIADNYLAAASALGLTREDLAGCARNSLEATFAPESERTAWLAELDAYLAAV